MCGSGTTRNYITLKRLTCGNAFRKVQVPPEITSLSNILRHVAGGLLVQVPPEITSLSNVAQLYEWGIRVQVPPEITSLSNEVWPCHLPREFRYHPKLHHSQTSATLSSRRDGSGTTRNYITLKPTRM